MPRIYTTGSVRDRFFAHVQQIGECWAWSGRLGTYGTLCIDGKKQYAHRLSWELHRGPIPDGLFVCHNCPGGDNPGCVRPDHLFLGDQHANMADMSRKGRAATGDRSGARKHPEGRHYGDDHHARKHPERLARGGHHGQAKLRTADVLAIRTAAANGAKQRDLAKQYGVNFSHLSAIVLRKKWEHV